MNETPKGERTHIGFFGRTNTGKSSLVNALTGQPVSIVSEVAGTTTDPVQKAMELLPLGPVLLLDTAGLDDVTELGEQRTERTMAALRKTDIAVLVADAREKPSQTECEFIEQIKVPLVIALNTFDGGYGARADWESLGKDVLTVNAKDGTGIAVLKEYLAAMRPDRVQRILVRDLVPAGRTCVLVVPIDKAAPKGRLILPQQQVIRDLLDGGVSALVTRDTEYAHTLASLREPPALVVTDSQVFGMVAQNTPDTIPLTSFSILFARYKGELAMQAEGARAVENLRDGDRVLICEGCTHHRQCDDIGTVKIPGWLRKYTEKHLEFDFTSGAAFPDVLAPYRLVVHCGGCTLSEREMLVRLRLAKNAGVPITNYGVLIAHIHDILPRALQPLGL